MYPVLSIALKAAQAKAQFDNIMELNLADYQETNFDFDEKYPGVNATEKEVAKIPDLRLKLKNAVLHWMSNTRITNKQNSFKTVLDRATAKYGQQKEKAENLRRKLATMPFMKRLETLEVMDARITDNNFDRIKDAATKIAKNDLLQSVRQVNQLTAVINKLIPQTERIENYDFVTENGVRGV